MEHRIEFLRVSYDVLQVLSPYSTISVTFTVRAGSYSSCSTVLFQEIKAVNALVGKAFKQVKDAFASRGKPRFIPHCKMCYTDEKIDHLLSIPYSHLTVEDLRPILWDGYMCWGTWPQIAYYIPRLLEFYYEDTIPDDEQLYAKLLLAVRPELELSVGKPNIVDEMTDEERKSVFSFVAAVLEYRLIEDADCDRAWIMFETLGFLTAFDQPILPLLAKLENSDNQRTRANICLVLADNTLSPESFSNMYLKRLTMLPKNEKALGSFFSSAHVAKYLSLHAGDVAMFGKERMADVNFAYEWAMSQHEAV